MSATLIGKVQPYPISSAFFVSDPSLLPRTVARKLALSRPSALVKTQTGRIFFFLDEVRELSRQNDGKSMTGLHSNACQDPRKSLSLPSFATFDLSDPLVSELSLHEILSEYSA